MSQSYEYPPSVPILSNAFSMIVTFFFRRPSDAYATTSPEKFADAVLMAREAPNEEIELKPIGHSHYAGKDGSLDSDLSTLTTALNIIEKVTVKVMP